LGFFRETLKKTIAGSGVRAGIVALPEHYLYSSAVNYAGNAGVLEVELMDAMGLVPPLFVGDL
jgi:hypothetical protein